MIADWTPPGTGRQLDARTPGYTMPIASAAVALGVLPAKLAEWRVRGIGPDWCRDGEHGNSPVLYEPAVIKDLARQMREARAAEPKAAITERIAHAHKTHPTNKTKPRKRK